MDLKEVFYIKLVISVFVTDMLASVLNTDTNAEQCSEIFNSHFTPSSRSTELFFKKQNKLKNCNECLDTIEEISELERPEDVFCFRDTRQAEETLCTLQQTLGISRHNKALLLSEIYENSRRKHSEKKNNPKKIKNTNALKEKLFHLRQNNIKIYVYNSKLNENDTFDISYMTDTEIEMCIQNAFRYETSSQEVSLNGKKLIKISDILNMLFREFLDKDDCFLQAPITICGKNGYFSKKALHFVQTKRYVFF